MELLEKLLDEGIKFEIDALSPGVDLLRCIKCPKLFFRSEKLMHGFRCGCYMCQNCLKETIYAKCGRGKDNILKAERTHLCPICPQPGSEDIFSDCKFKVLKRFFQELAQVAIDSDRPKVVRQCKLCNKEGTDLINLSCNPKATGDEEIDIKNSHSFHIECAREFILAFPKVENVENVEGK
jgi:hypothetical protein